MNPIFIAAAVILALSVGGNVLLWNLHGKALEEKADAEAKHALALAAADACNRAVTELQRLGKEREAEARKRLASAQQKAKAAEGRALATLQIIPTVPNDACASAKALHRDRLEARRAGKW